MKKKECERKKIILDIKIRKENEGKLEKLYLFKIG